MKLSWKLMLNLPMSMDDMAHYRQSLSQQNKYWLGNRRNLAAAAVAEKQLAILARQPPEPCSCGSLLKKTSFSLALCVS